ncbi:AzlD domain-containing protein [Rhodanobacter aciditrophus]|uniref:AzlD domain-containing protein n=1 Tax=Rhodanobacter aciditrophus TaxID=1623218 RepID=A0ABW4B0W9_9GAMM
MSNLSLVLIVLGMFVVTFSIRFVLFASAQKAAMPLWLESGLKYVPVSVLTGIIAPMSLTDNVGLNISLTNPWFVGALVSLVVGVLLKRQLLTISIGVAAFFLAKLLVSP